MKMTKIASLVALALVLSVGVSYAQDSVDIQRDQSTIGKMMHKLGRGVVNVVTCWVEVPRQISIQWEKTDPVTGFFVGGAEGIGWGFARLTTGAFETVTFLFPVPPGYGPLLEPEFVVTNVWGEGIPELTQLDSNDPKHPANAPIYPNQFNF